MYCNFKLLNMKTHTKSLTELFDEVSELSQKLFFHPIRTGPTDQNPTHSSLWKDYIDRRKQINELVGKQAKVVAVVITMSTGNHQYYYSELIMGSEDFQLRLRQAERFGSRNIIKIERLIDE